MSRLVDAREMELIYSYCVKVFDHKTTTNSACEELRGKTPSSESSLKMYFNIYSCMRKGTCYKMGTSAAFTRFLIERIFHDYGEDALYKALSSAKQNAEYRILCNNEQPGIEKTCRDIISEYKLPLNYEDLPSYNQDKPVTKDEITESHRAKKEMSLSVSYGPSSLTVTGSAEKVLRELSVFLANLIGDNNEKKSLSHGGSKVDKNSISTRKDVNPAKNNLPVGKAVLNKHPEISKLKQKKDFKARMIPILFLASECNLQDTFSITDIQTIMFDAIGEKPIKNLIEDVFNRRSSWFEKVKNNPRTFKLLAIAKDYARNILNE